MRLTPEPNADDELSNRQALRLLVESRTWKEVVVPNLEGRIRILEENLAFAKSTPIDEIRVRQGEHSVWRLLLTDPMSALQRVHK